LPSKYIKDLRTGDDLNFACQVLWLRHYLFRFSVLLSLMRLLLLLLRWR